MATLDVDYGSWPMENGQLPNRDPETGTRYGIVSSRWDLAEWLDSEWESEYLHGCGYCGDELPEDFETPADCPHCGETLEDGDDWGDEPICHRWEGDGIRLMLDSSGDVWVFASPVRARGRHCSPCAPGAATIYPPSETAKLVADGDDSATAYGLPAEFWEECRQ